MNKYWTLEETRVVVTIPHPALSAVFKEEQRREIDIDTAKSDKEMNKYWTLEETRVVVTIPHLALSTVLVSNP